MQDSSRAILETLVYKSPQSSFQIGTRTGLSSNKIGGALASCRKAGYVEKGRGGWTITDKGKAIAGPLESFATNAQLLAVQRVRAPGESAVPSLEERLSRLEAAERAAADENAAILKQLQRLQDFCDALGLDET